MSADQLKPVMKPVDLTTRQVEIGMGGTGYRPSLNFRTVIGADGRIRIQQLWTGFLCLEGEWRDIPVVLEAYPGQYPDGDKFKIR